MIHAGGYFVIVVGDIDHGDFPAVPQAIYHLENSFSVGLVKPGAELVQIFPGNPSWSRFDTKPIRSFISQMLSPVSRLFPKR